MTVHDALRKRLLEQAGLSGQPFGSAPPPDIILAEQWSERFESLRKARMVMGFFRYGPKEHTGATYDNVQSAIDRLELYRDTGNSEHLVDVANLCEIEFTQENHPAFHFTAEDDQYHTAKHGE